jgi:hypothetical protein
MPRYLIDVDVTLKHTVEIESDSLASAELDAMSYVERLTPYLLVVDANRRSARAWNGRRKPERPTEGARE